jgi:ABC-type multidrug transport system fused ATPase/permease subunit
MPVQFWTREFGRSLWMSWKGATHFVRIRLLAVIALVIGAALLAAMSPVALKVVVDRVAGSPGAKAASLSEVVALYIACQWLARTAGEVRGLLYARAERRVLRTVSERVFVHLLHLPLRFHLQRQTGAIMQTLDSGLEGIQLIMHHSVFAVGPVLVELAAEVVVLGRLVSPAFLGLFCMAIGCYAVAFGCAAGRITRCGRAASAARGDVAATMTDGLLNLETVKYFAAEESVKNRVCRELDRCEARWVLFYRKYSVTGVTVACIFAAFLAATIVLASVEVRNGEL